MGELNIPYLNELNEIQRKAVTHQNGPVMVIAGPGSGKTRVLTYRIAHLIRSGVAPWNILALTFTNKAAKEMKHRIEGVIGGGSANKIWAGTFHSLFARILRSEAHKIGYPNDFSIYDTDDSKSVVSDIIKSLKLDKKVYNNGAIRSRISSAKSNLITPKAYAVNEELLALDRMNRRPLVYQIYEKYAAACKRAGAMDFDDLLLQMFRLLYQNPDGVREKYQDIFKYVLVDEFQDTNYLQYQIVKLLTKYSGSPENITIVGDDAQSIYSFRGATIENILQFEDDFSDTATYKLEQNYRSTQYIVDAANEVINHNRKQIPKKIWTEKTEGTKIKLIKAMTENEEGKRIADSIIEQKNRFNLRNSEFAILYRTNAQSRVFEEQLRRYNLPYRIYGGMSFYQRKEIKDVIAYLRLTINDRDDEALKRIINYPRRGIGAKTIQSIKDVAEEHDMNMWNVLAQMEFGPRSKKSLVEFVQLIKSFKSYAFRGNAYETANYIVRKSGIIDLLKQDQSPEGMGRVENINALLDAIKEFVESDEVIDEETTEKSLAVFLQSISLMTDADNDDESVDTITLMSVHAAKGLEFPSVFVAGLEENLFPSYMSISLPDQLDEERRLFYVAITRAEKFLTLSFANSRYQFGQMKFNDPSRFIDEISDHNFESITILKDRSPKFGTPKVLGNFKTLGRAKPSLNIDPTDFVASNPSQIKPGQKVVHLKFGQGTVVSIDERQIATINFDSLGDDGEKRIMLKYAKLQILD